MHDHHHHGDGHGHGLAQEYFPFDGDRFNQLGQLIFIRHGEKPGDHANENLNEEGDFRANHLFRLFSNGPGNRPAGDAYNVPGVIYAMRQEPGGSNRPYETVEPLAEQLGLANPPLGDIAPNNQNPANGLIWNNTFYRDQQQEVVQNVLGNANYANKTVLFCWEHHAIPLIFNRFGLNTALGLDEVFWGEDPTTPVEENNFTAIWVITPTGGDTPDFKIYREFNIVHQNGNLRMDPDLEPPLDNQARDYYQTPTYPPQN